MLHPGILKDLATSEASHVFCDEAVFCATTIKDCPKEKRNPRRIRAASQSSTFWSNRLSQAGGIVSTPEWGGDPSNGSITRNFTKATGERKLLA
jgi:hypothetical protein